MSDEEEPTHPKIIGQGSGKTPNPLQSWNHPLTTSTDRWFHETSDQWPGMAQTLRVKKVLHTEKSLYQDVLVFESTNHGTILVLDGAIQCSTKDEHSYDCVSSIMSPHASLALCHLCGSSSPANASPGIKR